VIYGLVAALVQGVLIRRFKWTPATLLKSGLPVALIGFLVFLVADSFPTLTTALVLQGFGQGLVLPGVTAGLSLAVGDEEQGSVAGLNGSAQAFARMLGPIVGTGLYELRPLYPYIFSATLLAAMLGFLLASARMRRALAG